MYLADNYNRAAEQHNRDRPEEEPWKILLDTPKMQGLQTRMSC